MKKKKEKTRHKISDSALYKLKSKSKLAALLFTSEKAIQETLQEIEPYKRCWKHKKEEKWLDSEPNAKLKCEYRPIDIPTPRRKAYQKRIADLLSRIEPPDYLYSPVKGRSYVNNARHHLGSKAFRMLDIADFFPSCSANNVAWFFGKVMGCSPDVTAILVRLTTHNESLPQGSPCSPILAYFSNSNMWSDIANLAQNHGCCLSIYADDITVSGGVVPERLIWAIKQRVRKQNLRLKRDKDKSVFNKPVEITGVIVSNGKSLLPNRQHKALSVLRKDRARSKNADEKKRLDNQILGRKSQRDQVESA